MEAGRFDHSGLLVSPVAEVIRPGSFVRLRFRRMEAVGFLVASDAPPASPESAPPNPSIEKLPVGGSRFLIENPLGTAQRPTVENTVHLFRTVHEGLAFDVDLDAVKHANVRFKLATPRKAATAGEEAALRCDDKSEGTVIDAAS